MKICFYNWSDYKDPRSLGGGVNVYQKNIMEYISKNEIGVETYFISSGVGYNLLKKSTYYTRNGNDFKIMNSGVTAPSHYSFFSENQISHKETEECLLDILSEIGDIDILHLNNLEGIPISVLPMIKNKYTNVKIVYSVHNYYPFCPQVNLWERESRNCVDYQEGMSCINCINGNQNINESIYKKKYFIEYITSKLKISSRGIPYNIAKKSFIGFRSIYKIAQRNRGDEFKIEELSSRKNYFKSRRYLFIKIINQNCDKVIAVSDRVKDICISFGINKKLLRTAYIGTSHYTLYLKSEQKNKDIRTICFMGYMRKDKGFEFFVDAMSAMNSSYSKNINLVISAKNTNNFYFYKIKELTKKFKSVNFSNGYNHKTIEHVLENVDLTIIPVLWEDNLPQVAIESHCRKIPLLTSDLGGASELHGKNSLFTFRAGDQRDFLVKIYNLFDHGYDREQYMKNSLSPRSMKEHIDEIINIYNEL